MKTRTLAACALLGAVLIFACGAARGADPPRIEGWEPAQRKFMAWQGRMLKRRAEPTEEMKRIFYHKTTVPPPSPPAQEGMWRKIKYPMRFDYSIFDPMGLLPAMPDLRVGLGDPTVRVSFKVQAGLLNLRMLSHDIPLFAVGPGSEEAFGDAKTVMKTGLLGVPLSRYGLKGEAALTSQLTAHGLEPTGAVAELGGSYGLVSGAVKVGLDPNAPVIGASVDVGPQLVPEQYSDVAQVKPQVQLFGAYDLDPNPRARVSNICINSKILICWCSCKDAVHHCFYSPICLTCTFYIIYE